MSPGRDTWIAANDPSIWRNLASFGSPDRLYCYWAGPTAEVQMLEDLAAEIPGQHWPAVTRDCKPEPWTFPENADAIIGHGQWMRWLDRYADVLPRCPRINIVFCDTDYYRGYRYDRNNPAEGTWDFSVVDGIVTNSRRLALELMKAGVRTRFSLHAAPERFFSARPKTRYECDVCWAGSIWTDGSYHKRWPLVLTPAAEAARECGATMNLYGLIYRSGSREKLTALGAKHVGWIPFEDLPSAYASARIILGLTQDSQHDWGMINNRTYEAMAAGKPLVCDWFGALDEEGISQFLWPVRSADEAREVVGALLTDTATQEEAARRRRAGRAWVRKHATYGRIAGAVTDLLSEMN